MKLLEDLELCARAFLRENDQLRAAIGWTCPPAGIPKLLQAIDNPSGVGGITAPLMCQCSHGLASVDVQAHECARVIGSQIPGFERSVAVWACRNEEIEQHLPRSGCDRGFRLR